MSPFSLALERLRTRAINEGEDTRAIFDGLWKTRAARLQVENALYRLIQGDVAAEALKPHVMLRREIRVVEARCYRLLRSLLPR